jgi:hypothetical protein
MKRIVTAFLLIAAPLAAVANSPPTSLNTDQAEQVRCVAVLAVASYEQQRGAPGWAGFPWLPVRGKKFSGIVGDTLVKDAGLSRDAVKAQIVDQVAALQRRVNPGLELQTLVRSCIPLMDKLVPPKAPPSLPVCAAVVALAAQDATAADAGSVQARQLSNVAAILDAKAREELRMGGNTERENDVILGLEREKIVAQSKRNRARGEADDLDIEHCFATAAKE